MKLKQNDPYIIDSLGWALFKLKRFEESKDYLQLAVRLMPADPIVNDHYGDILWKLNRKIQARYFWLMVLEMEDAEEERAKWNTGVIVNYETGKCVQQIRSFTDAERARAEERARINRDNGN